jgi:DNA-directed RNA polymerase subunit K/omega
MQTIHETTKEDLESRNLNVYEAILVMGARARQVAAHHKSIVTKLHEDYQANMTMTDEVPDEPEEIDLPHFTKPTIVAVSEMLNGDVKYDYLDADTSGSDEG